MGEGYAPQQCYTEDDNDWAIFITKGYFLDFPLLDVKYKVSLNEQVFYRNLNKNYTYTTGEVKYFTDNVFHISSYAELGNSGSGVFNYEGQLVGILVTRWPDKTTGIVPVSPGMFEGIEEVLWTEPEPEEVVVVEKEPIKVIYKLERFSYFP